MACLGLKQLRWRDIDRIYRESGRVVVAFHAEIEFHSAVRRSVLLRARLRELRRCLSHQNSTPDVLLFLKEQQMKSLDCLQLACALESSLPIGSFVSRDDRLNAAASKSGLKHSNPLRTSFPSAPFPSCSPASPSQSEFLQRLNRISESNRTGFAAIRSSYFTYRRV